VQNLFQEKITNKIIILKVKYVWYKNGKFIVNQNSTSGRLVNWREGAVGGKGMGRLRSRLVNCGVEAVSIVGDW
jgi:hypothetical protein